MLTHRSCMIVAHSRFRIGGCGSASRPSISFSAPLAREQRRQRRSGVGACPFAIDHMTSSAPAAREFAPDVRIALRTQRRVQQQEEQEEEKGQYLTLGVSRPWVESLLAYR